jgi:hypothetical protein
MERIQRPKPHREPGKPASRGIVVPTLDRNARVQARLEVIDELQPCPSRVRRGHVFPAHLSRQSGEEFHFDQVAHRRARVGTKRQMTGADLEVDGRYTAG